MECRRDPDEAEHNRREYRQDFIHALSFLRHDDESTSAPNRRFSNERAGAE